MEKLTISDIKKRISELEEEIKKNAENLYSEEYKEVEKTIYKLRNEIYKLESFLYKIALKTVFTDEQAMRKILAGFLKNAKDELETYQKEKEKIETKQGRYRNMPEDEYGKKLEYINRMIHNLKVDIEELKKMSKSGKKQEAILRYSSCYYMNDNAKSMRNHNLDFSELYDIDSRQLPKSDIAPISPEVKQILMDISVDASGYKAHQKKKKDIEQRLKEYEGREWFELINGIIFDANGKLNVQLVNGYGSSVDKYDIETADIENIMNSCQDSVDSILERSSSDKGFETINPTDLSLTCNPFGRLVISASPSLMNDAEQYNSIIADIKQCKDQIQTYEENLKEPYIASKEEKEELDKESGKDDFIYTTIKLSKITRRPYTKSYKTPLSRMLFKYLKKDEYEKREQDYKEKLERIQRLIKQEEDNKRKLEEAKNKLKDLEAAKEQFESSHQQDMLKIKLIDPMQLSKQSVRILHPELKKSPEIEEYIKLVIQYHVSSRISDQNEKKYSIDMDRLARIPNLPQYVIDQINAARTKGHIEPINANLEKNIEQYGILPEDIALQGLLSGGVDTTMSTDEAADLIQRKK